MSEIEEVPSATTEGRLHQEVLSTLTRFTDWLAFYGETSWDHQSYYAGPIGRWAKSLYYKSRKIGTAAVAPMVFSEAFVPHARRLFHHRIRLPIADAHYAMGFAFLFETTGKHFFFGRAVHFLNILKQTRCPGFNEYCWGYPFEWVTRGGMIARETPLITTTPYVYEAFAQLYDIEARDEWKQVLSSIARHVANDIKEFDEGPNASRSSYTPFDSGSVINAAAYRAALLTSASQLLGDAEYWRRAERNLNFVLQTQQGDGSWLYAADGVRDFVDHFHTCFVMKALAKIHALTNHGGCGRALDLAVEYYLENLFDADGLPKPFAKAPRLTVYKRELYDCAECINLCLLLGEKYPQLNRGLETVVGHILEQWVKPDGSFRSRRLHFGWDNVPMHRWGQSQMFRSLAFYLREHSSRPVSENAAARNRCGDQMPLAAFTR